MAGPSKTDLMYEIVYNPGFVAVRSSRVSVKTVTEGTETRHLMRNHGTGEYYDLDEASKIVWDLTDGKRNIQQIVQESQGSGKVRESDSVIETLLFFAESGALTSEADPARKRRIRIISSFETQITLIKESGKLLGIAHKILRPILRGSLFWVSMVLVLIAVIIYAPRFSSTFDDAVNFQVLGSTVVGFFFYQFIVLAPVIAIHELAHGLALVHYGGRAGEIGTGLFYFGPMFYVDATDSWSLSRRQRIMIMWAGNLSTVLIGALIVLAGLFIQYPPTMATPLNMVAFWCFYSTLWQLAPPFETDGYYMLADLVNIPELRRDGFAYFKSLTLRIFGGSAPEPEGLTPRKRRILLGYAIFSIAFVAYLAFQSLRFTVYMANDAASWAGKIGLSALSGETMPLLAYFVGLTSVGYFAMTLSGYGVVVGNQLRKSLIRTLRFEALHDRDLSVFFYLPAQIPSSMANKLEVKIRSIARRITSNFSVGREGPLFYANLRMGGTSLPLSQVKVHLRRIEDKFYRVYQNLLAWKSRAAVRHLTSFPSRSMLLADLLSDMADKTPPGERSEVKGALKEFLERQQRTARYLLSSTFATVWTIEIPPAQQYELEESLLPSLLVQDLTMTNLVDEIEEFKKGTLYGLDSIAELSAKSSVMQQEALARPERFQVIAFFEPVRGRIIFIGRTERIEKDLKELGSLFIIQVWSGYLDNLLGDVNLNLYSIVNSFPALPVDLTALRDGEVRALDRYISSIEQLEKPVLDALAGSQETIRPCRVRLRELKMLFQPERGSRVGLFEPILSLNVENLRSIPSRLKEFGNLSRRSFGWVQALKKPVDKERGKREATYLAKKKRLIRAYAAIGLLSAVLVTTGLLQTRFSLALPLLGFVTSIQVAYFGAFYLFWRSAHRVPRYTSMMFSQILTSMYALTQTLDNLVTGASVLNPGEILAKTGKKGREVRAADRQPSPVTP